eukprot:s1998_g14.t1
MRELKLPEDHSPALGAVRLCTCFFMLLISMLKAEKEKNRRELCFRSFFAVCGKMGSAADGEMPSETVVETPMTPVAPLPPMPPLTPLAPVIAAAVATAEAPEPSSSKPETEEQEAEGKFGPDGLTVTEALETEREAKRPRQMTQAEALKAVQEQLGETASLAYHSESCQRYALAAINASAGHIKGMAWQLTGSRNEERVSKLLLPGILTMLFDRILDTSGAEVEEEGMSDHDITMKCLRLVQSSLEYTARQAAALKAVQEQLGETASLAYHSESCQRYALAAINASAGQIADGYARGTVPTGTPITPTTSAAPVGAASVFPPPAPVMPGYAASVSGGSPAGIGGYVGPVSGSYGAPAPAPPPPTSPAPAPGRNPIMLQLRQADGSILQRQASPTRYLDDSLRSNAGFVWCDDHSYRRLI